MFALATIPAAVLLVGMTRCREPRWLVESGRLDEARAAPARLRRPGDDVEAEIAGIRGVQDTTPGRAWTQMRKAWLRPAILVALGIAMFSQLTGINAVVYYAPTV